mmetsp:Transcript_23393/g.55734  ORF Transcript_23393/g.55734 Transcript_23393/m.55734 type:complete len:388 (-) Transcript_23393:252-1415(-)
MDSKFFTRLRNLDVYPKTMQDYQVKTVAGATVSILGIITIILLVFGELSIYLKVNTEHQLSVDASRGDKLPINFNITFHRMPCSIISLDTMDISGEHHVDVTHEVYKQRLDERGRSVAEAEREHDIHSNKSRVNDVLSGQAQEVAAVSCGSCYGAEENPGDCCNTCDEVRDAYRKRGWAFLNMDHISQCKDEQFLVKLQEERHEGCRITGTLEVSKVAGNFHFAPGKSYSQIGIQLQEIIILQRTDYNVSHTVNHLSFGTVYPGRVNPLDDSHRICHDRSGMFQYFVKVVPTEYRFLNKTGLNTFQFASTQHYRKLEGLQRGLPGVFFFYDLSPIKATFQESSSSFLHFLTGLCAIVGGVFTVAGMLDSTIYTGQRLAQKMQLGKQS